MTAPTPTSASVGGSAAGFGAALASGAVAGVVANVANVAISAIARGRFGASDDFVPLTFGAVVMWTMIGTLLGALGWRLIVNRSTRSRAVLTVLVPTVLVLSLIPDVAALLATDSTPGQTTSGVVALMVMHVVTAVIAVAAYRKAMPAG